MELAKCLELNRHEIVSIVGSGGKTSLLNYLAQYYRQEYTVMTTTTKIFLPRTIDYDRAILTNNKSFILDKGITLLGAPLPRVNKLAQPVLPVLKKAFKQADKVFIEADGAKMRPLKGWWTTEPVIIPETTTTVGVIPLSVCGQSICEQTVHRLPEFLALGDFKYHQLITPVVLARVISQSGGLFQHSQGRKILFLNQAECAALQSDYEVLAALSTRFLRQLALVISGSIKTQQGMIIWRNEQLQKQS